MQPDKFLKSDSMGHHHIRHSYYIIHLLSLRILKAE